MARRVPVNFPLLPGRVVVIGGRACVMADWLLALMDVTPALVKGPGALERAWETRDALLEARRTGTAWVPIDLAVLKHLGDTIDAGVPAPGFLLPSREYVEEIREAVETGRNRAGDAAFAAGIAALEPGPQAAKNSEVASK